MSATIVIVCPHHWIYSKEGSPYRHPWLTLRVTFYYMHMVVQDLAVICRVEGTL